MNLQVQYDKNHQLSVIGECIVPLHLSNCHALACEF